MILCKNCGERTYWTKDGKLDHMCGLESQKLKIKALENALLVKQTNVRCSSVSTIPQNLNMFVQEAEAQRNSGKKAWQYRMPAHLESKKWCKKYLPKHRE